MDLTKISNFIKFKSNLKLNKNSLKGEKGMEILEKCKKCPAVINSRNCWDKIEEKDCQANFQSPEILNFYLEPGRMPNKEELD